MKSVNDCVHVRYYFAVPSMLENGIQADATAYFGRIVTNSTRGTPVFPFRIVIDLSRFGDDLSAILTVLNRNNLVESLFKFSNSQNQRTFSFNEGVVAANASGMLPPQVTLLENRFVVFDDYVIYQEAPPSSLQLPTTLDFDLSVLVVAFDSGNSQSVRFAVGIVSLIPPPGNYGHY